MTVPVGPSARTDPPPAPARTRRLLVVAMVFVLVTVLGGALFWLGDRDAVPVGDFEAMVGERDDAQVRLEEANARFADLEGRFGDLEASNAELRSHLADIQAELDQTGVLLEAASRPEMRVAALGESFVVGDFEVELLTVTFELPSPGGFVVAPADMGEGDVPLTLELRLLAGDPDTFGHVETWLEDDRGEEIGVSAELLSANDAVYTRIFKLSEESATLILHFATGEAFDLSGLLDEQTSAVEPPTTEAVAGPEPAPPTTAAPEIEVDIPLMPSIPPPEVTTPSMPIECLLDPTLWTCPGSSWWCAQYPYSSSCFHPSITLPPPPWEP